MAAGKVKRVRLLALAVALGLAQSVAARESGRADPLLAPLSGGAAPDVDVASPPNPTPTQAKPAPIGNPLWAIPIRTLSATRDRPLFSPSRRPPTPVVAAVAAPAPMPVALKPAPPEPPPLILVGTIVGDSDRFALLYNTNTKIVKRLKEGEEESGWRVSSVAFRSAVVEKDERSITLALPKPGDTNPATALQNLTPRPATAADNL
ncbi:hypothetical protein [Methylocapsa sp. S129]|uniref:hypothetical protein n=1 Tax=Methylocapsa sp. S129 TaxID=1641869 RepID=UPI00131D0A48|nr:hypothetical protein [Methylocapsa sp. S129]